MRLWRLSGAAFADRFDGGYGLEHAGRWNERGRSVTYCTTGPALCVLEKLVHVEDADLLPDDTMLIRYDVSDDLQTQESRLADLPENWRAWLERASSCMPRASRSQESRDSRTIPDCLRDSSDDRACAAATSFGGRRCRSVIVPAPPEPP